MEQKYDGTPKPENRLERPRVTRSHVVNDFALMLRWVVTRDGKEIATVPARAESSYEHADKTPGKYEIVLQSWKYVNYLKDGKGEFTKSQFVAISNVVKYTI